MTDLINTTEDDVDSFLILNNLANRTRANNMTWNYDVFNIIPIKVLQFELRDRFACNVLQFCFTLVAINADSLRTLVRKRIKYRRQINVWNYWITATSMLQLLLLLILKMLSRKHKSATSYLVGAVSILLDYSIHTNTLAVIIQYEAIGWTHWNIVSTCMAMIIF